MKTIKVKELEVPTGIMAEVAELLDEKEIVNTITGGNSDDEIIFIDVQYDTDEDEKKKGIIEIQTMIEEYDENDNEEEDEK